MSTCRPGTSSSWPRPRLPTIAKKQASIAMSSTKSEIMAASLAALEAVFLRGLLSEVGCEQHDPIVIGIDNQGAIALSKNYISNSRTKHINRRHLKIRELVEQFVVRPEFVPTDETRRGHHDQAAGAEQVREVPSCPP